MLVAQFAMDGAMLDANDNFLRVLGHARDGLAGLNHRDLCEPGGGEDGSHAELWRRLVAGQAVSGRCRRSDRQGRPVWLDATYLCVPGEAGAPARIVCIARDATREARQQEELGLLSLMQRKVLQALVDEQPLAEVIDLICQEVRRLLPDVRVAVLEPDGDGRLRALAAPGLPDGLARGLAALAPVPPGGDAAALAAHLRDDAAGLRALAARAGLEPGWCAPVCGGTAGARAALVFLCPAGRAMDDLHRRLAGICTDLCGLALERHQARMRIRQLAYYDALTGLPNRSLFAEQAGAAVARAAAQGLPLAVLFVDLDRFKLVNDTLGHLAGDALLREMAGRLRRHAGPQDICCRLSGDEFALVLAGAGPAAAIAAAESIARAAAEPLPVGDATLYPTISVGIALHPEHGAALDALLRHADMAMYQAKTAGRNQYRVFSGGMDRVAMERKLREALERDDGQLHLAYQPQLALADGRLYGVEALARWRHPVLGPVAPDYFVPLAEESGLIVPIGSWALREACRQLALWRAAGLAVPAISVNLSPTHFHNPDLPAIVAATLAEFALAAGDLTVELTESVFMDPDPVTARTVAAVHELGVRLSVDDFGTGYSSLGQLRRLPVDELKLDRSFVNDVATDPVARALAQAVLSLGESMRLSVVAEGVETPAQRDFLRRAGCAAAQGYLVSPPMEGEVLSAWLAERAGGPGS